MPKITVKQFIDAPLDAVWASWADFGNVERFNPAVRESRILGDGDEALAVGTVRECELSDDKNWLRERIVEMAPKRTLVTEVFETSLPVDSMRAIVRMRVLQDKRTEVVMTVEFVPRRGLIGKLMAPVMKRQYRPIVAAILDGNARYVEGSDSRQRAA